MIFMGESHLSSSRTGANWPKLPEPWAQEGKKGGFSIYLLRTKAQESIRRPKDSFECTCASETRAPGEPKRASGEPLESFECACASETRFTVETQERPRRAPGDPMRASGEPKRALSSPVQAKCEPPESPGEHQESPGEL